MCKSIYNNNNNLSTTSFSTHFFPISFDLYIINALILRISRFKLKFQNFSHIDLFKTSFKNYLRVWFFTLFKMILNKIDKFIITSFQIFVFYSSVTVLIAVKAILYLSCSIKKWQLRNFNLFFSKSVNLSKDLKYPHLPRGFLTNIIKQILTLNLVLLSAEILEKEK